MCDSVPHGSFVLPIRRQSLLVFPADLRTLLAIEGPVSVTVAVDVFLP